MIRSVLGILLMWSSLAQAELLVSEYFNHPNGNIVGRVPSPGPGSAWAAHAIAGVGPVQVVDGRLEVVQNFGFSEDVHVGFNAVASGTVLYSSFDLVIAAPGSITGGYFSHYLLGTSNFTERLYVFPPALSGYKLALSNGANPSLATYWPNDLDLDKQYRVVFSYDMLNKNGSLWVNPINQGSPSVVASDPGFATAVSSLAFRQFSSGSWKASVDNLRVATTFTEALGVPEPTSLWIFLIVVVAPLERRMSRI